MSIGGTPGIGGLPAGAGVAPPARPEGLSGPAPSLAPVAPAEAERARDQLQSAGLDLVMAPGETGTDLDALVDDDLLNPDLGVLGKGSDPAAVRALQSALNALGQTPPLAVDGAYGPKTTQAVKALQEKLGLKADGLAGPNTLRALQAQEAMAMAAAAPDSETAQAFLEHAEAMIAGIQPESEQSLLRESLSAQAAAIASAAEAPPPPPSDVPPEADFGNAMDANPAAGMMVGEEAVPTPAPAAESPVAAAPAPAPLPVPPSDAPLEADFGNAMDANPAAGMMVGEEAAPAPAPAAESPVAAAPAAEAPPAAAPEEAPHLPAPEEVAALPSDPGSRLSQALTSDPAAPALSALVQDPEWMASASLDQKKTLLTAMAGGFAEEQGPVAFDLKEADNMAAFAQLTLSLAASDPELGKTAWELGVQKAMQDQVPMHEATLTMAVVAGMDDAALAALFQGEGAAWAEAMGTAMAMASDVNPDLYGPTLVRLEEASV